jgi:hypothetical protein
MYTILEFLKNPFRWYKERQAFERRKKELRDNDPFIYK